MSKRKYHLTLVGINLMSIVAAVTAYVQTGHPWVSLLIMLGSVTVDFLAELLRSGVKS